MYRFLHSFYKIVGNTLCAGTDQSMFVLSFKITFLSLKDNLKVDQTGQSNIELLIPVQFSIKGRSVVRNFNPWVPNISSPLHLSGFHKVPINKLKKSMGSQEPTLTTPLKDTGLMVHLTSKRTVSIKHTVLPFFQISILNVQYDLRIGRFKN